MALMTQARGHAAICETVFENRFQHVAELARMGASISVEGNLAKVTGPSALRRQGDGDRPARASACLVIAGLVAQGETVVDRIYHLDRGYEAMEQKLRSLGGDGSSGSPAPECSRASSSQPSPSIRASSW